MVYDCFSFFNELDLLEIRLRILNSHVDKFVLVEATRTFSNKEKPLYFEENKERFKKFEKKIIHIPLRDLPEAKTDWTYENYQRNMIMAGLGSCAPDDVILISDLDEIPSPETILSYKKNGIHRLRQEQLSYFLNYKAILQKYWYGTRILCYRDILENETEKYPYKYSTFLIEELNQGCTPTKIRMIKDFPIIQRGGWHFTYLGGLERVKYKIESFAHQEFNNKKYTSDEVIRKSIEQGYDLFNPKDNRFIPVRIGKDFPEYLVLNKEKYKHLIYPVGLRTQIRNIGIVAQTLLVHGHYRVPMRLGRKAKKKLMALWKK